ncbi:Unknown protein sequence [Pseudomonas amygdali pv. lachrymans]|uniref:Uncharacterized protein n=1 Tax=Pseudomonas amygdali pv. lachrymans TaxID=53707 RepID=A0ABR5KSY9_PSEAV|nr:Unknown protein sequence [Pseudomonas amygdali pv. lachrymans]
MAWEWMFKSGLCSTSRLWAVKRVVTLPFPALKQALGV